MEGAFNALPGYILNFGFHYQCNTPATITWDVTACWVYTCPNGGVQNPAPYCFDNYTITISTLTSTYTVTVNKITYNWQDEHNAWPPGFYAALPALCGAGQPMHSQSANFYLAPISISQQTCCVPQFHYRIPAGKGGPNVALSSWCPANSNSGQFGSVCGASWSATPSQQCYKYCPSGTFAGESVGATSGGAIAGYTIAGVVVVGVLVLALWWSLRSGASGGGHKRTPSNIKDESVDLNSGRPAAPSGAYTADVAINTDAAD
jgi:hypothetical protein